MQDNYKAQARKAQASFLTYDQNVLIQKHHLKADDTYLYVSFLGDQYRICRQSGDISYFKNGDYQDGNSHGEVMTLLDLLCDSREDRHLSGNLKVMQDFGHQFHQNLHEQNPDALFFNSCPDKLKEACKTLGGIPFPLGDVAYSMPLFEDLSITLQLWLGDEEFAPRLRYLWDENALQYLKYETMYFAVDVLVQKIKQLL